MDNFPHGSLVNFAHLHATKESQVGDRRFLVLPKKNSPLSKYVTAAKFILRVMHFAEGFTPKLYTRRSCFFMLSKIVFVISWILKYELYKQTKKG